MLALVVALLGVLVGAAGHAGVHETRERTTSVAATCRSSGGPFIPRAVHIPGVVGRTAVLGLGRDRDGVPRTPPLTDRGKWQLAWDKRSRIRPGDPRGVVRLTAHTYPRDASYGLALGNRLLAELRTDALVVATGSDGGRLCYRVSRIMRVPARRTVPAYYASNGKPRLAILVCSGKRLGPGDWTHRTIWFATPVASTDP